MPTYYKEKYRNESIRLQEWDYRNDGAYFITICTANREPYFGNIVEGKMCLSNIGVLANVFWHEIKNHANNVKLDAFVVMPDHIHGILILEGNTVDIVDSVDLVGLVGSVGSIGSVDFVGTGHALSQQSPNPIDDQTIGQKRFQNIGKNSVSSIIGSYKSAVTKHARRLGYEFSWQTRFYEHIIRDEQSLDRIREYIKENPIMWEKKIK